MRKHLAPCNEDEEICDLEPSSAGKHKMQCQSEALYMCDSRQVTYILCRKLCASVSGLAVNNLCYEHFVDLYPVLS